jgi:ABC-type branched-subunit amino acid transport system ATPase component
MSVHENLLMGAMTSDPSHLADDLARVYALFPILHQRMD